MANSEYTAKVSIRGGTHEVRTIMRSATKWWLEYLCGKRLASNLTVTIELIDYLRRDQGVLGDCCGFEDDNNRPREFWIRIDTKQTPYTRMLALAHELIHVKQYAKNEMFDYQNRALYGATRFKNEVYWAQQMSYRELPWEKEAYAKEKKVMNAWVRATDNHEYVKQRKDYCD